MLSADTLDLAEEIIGYSFDDRNLLAKAITHPSAVEGHALEDSYERLEFLGDSLLGALVALELYERYPQMDEGALTRTRISLVSGGKLSSVAREMGLATCIVFGESELGTGGRGLRSALENVYEALVAAIFLDGGEGPCRQFVAGTLLDQTMPEVAGRPISAKSRLQELTQARYRCAPSYELVSQTGPAHEPVFTTEVKVAGKVAGKGSGSTKKESETRAAQAALASLEPERPDGPVRRFGDAGDGEAPCI